MIASQGWDDLGQIILSSQLLGNHDQWILVCRHVALGLVLARRRARQRRLLLRRRAALRRRRRRLRLLPRRAQRRPPSRARRARLPRQTSFKQNLSFGSPQRVVGAGVSRCAGDVSGLGG